MRTDLDHLPLRKRRELEEAVRIIHEEVASDLSLATGRRKAGRIVKIILYGSHARGGWVDKPHYQSDFDLLVIVNRKDMIERSEALEKASDRLMREVIHTRRMKTPVSIIAHTLQEVNSALAEGRYFFMDIAREGIALYEADGKALARPRPKTPEAALALAKEYFDEWYPDAGVFLKTFRFLMSERDWRHAAFVLHQATEQLYHCLLLVRTFYTPNSHNIKFLRDRAEPLDARLIDAWPRDTRQARARFEKLKDAYVKARYSKKFRISEEDLLWLGEQVEALDAAVKASCLERLAAFQGFAKSFVKGLGPAFAGMTGGWH
jgi:predicted nucleotidyltransferase/HEPN domain-containing protein